MNTKIEDMQKNFEIGDIVVVDDLNCIYDNEYYGLEDGEKVVLNKPYEIVDYDIELEDEYEVLYTLKDVRTGVICGVRFNDWEIEKVKKTIYK